jgi:hypothetical protein
LNTLAKKWGFDYTRFVDDLAMYAFGAFELILTLRSLQALLV